MPVRCCIAEPCLASPSADSAALVCVATIAATSSCLREIFDLQCAFFKLWGNDYLSAIGESLVTAVGVNTDVAKAYCLLVVKGEFAEFNKFYFALVDSKRKSLAAAAGGGGAGAGAGAGSGAAS